MTENGVECKAFEYGQVQEMPAMPAEPCPADYATDAAYTAAMQLYEQQKKAAEENGAVYHVGNVNSSAVFYGDHELVPEGLDSLYGLKKMGVDFECNMVIGKVLTIDELMGEYGYEAVFVGSGAGLPRFMGIPGESLKGVYSANEFLTRSNLMKAYLPTSKTPIRTGKKVAVVGGGNVAMDAARSALRLGAETVYIVYRRGMAELPARKEEVEHAEEEGIIFKTLCNPVEIHANDEGFVKSITCVEMELGEPDAKGRRKPVGTGKFETIEVTSVIGAIGQRVLKGGRGEGVVDRDLGAVLVGNFGGGRDVGDVEQRVGRGFHPDVRVLLLGECG